MIIGIPKEIKNNEYTKGFLNYIGVPRPIKSQIEVKESKLVQATIFIGSQKLLSELLNPLYNKNKHLQLFFLI